MPSSSFRTCADGFLEDTSSPLKQALDSDLEKQAQFAWSIQGRSTHRIDPVWADMFAQFGQSREGQLLQTKHAKPYWDRASRLCINYGLYSERAIALMFDIAVQNGSISRQTSQIIHRDFESLDPNLSWSKREEVCMEIIANRRAEAANPRWIEDVRCRKLTIARGEGHVHGLHYDLEREFDITLRSLAGR